jgi:hypothetical protein
MTTTFKQFETWIANETNQITTIFTTDEAAVMKFLAPLGQQILDAAKALGKATVQEGLQVLVSGATQAVAAGTAAEASGGNPVTAAETAFLTTAAAGGATVLHNAQAAAIKAAVAIAQSAVADVQAIVTPTEEPATETPTAE